MEENEVRSVVENSVMMMSGTECRNGAHVCMKYGFYGWERALVPAGNDKYPGIDTPRTLYQALLLLWCRQTCAPRMREDWTDENVTLGQCSITAFLAQDIFGGEVYGVPLPDGNYHCFNKVGDCVFDLTSEQFGETALDYENMVPQKRADHFAKTEKRQRYAYLCDLLDGYCRWGICRLPKNRWQNTVVPIRYTTDSHYAVTIEESEIGAVVRLEKTAFPVPVTHTPEEYDFPDKLYEEVRENACAWGITDPDTGELVACIETCMEPWWNRLQVTELWVREDLRRKGIGHHLMAIAKGEARLMGNRAVILETQSCNVDAIAFYRAEDFHLFGFDRSCYADNDIERGEVRLDLGWTCK